MKFVLYMPNFFYHHRRKRQANQHRRHHGDHEDAVQVFVAHNVLHKVDGRAHGPGHDVNKNVHQEHDNVVFVFDEQTERFPEIQIVGLLFILLMALQQLAFGKLLYGENRDRVDYKT